jgi:hypothetical protein
MKKQILMLLGVATLTYASANLTFIQTAASLSQPTNWDIGYINSPASADYLLTTKTIGTGTGSILNPGYTRTVDGSYFNYQTGIGGTGWDHGDFPAILPEGLTINTTFNRSNTTWSSSGTGLYYPQGGSIGSNNTVGAVIKDILIFDNQTSINYRLFLDFSSTNPGDTNFQFDLFYGNNQYDTYSDYVRTASFIMTSFYIPSYTTVKIQSLFVSTERKFDSWYLEDLGVSASYNQGYTQGETDGYDSGLSDGYDIGFDQGEIVGYEDGYEIGYDEGTEYGISAAPIQNIFTSVFSSIASIFNINIFGNITFGTIILAPIAVALLWFMLGIISGVGGK